MTNPNDQELTPDAPRLKRALNLPLLTLFGVGTMVGAGIYVLVGEVIGLSGVFAPWSFLLAAVVAAFTALSYGELAASFPRSAGEAVYVQEAFARRWLTALTGWAVVVTGLVSAATLTRGFAGYLTVFVPDAELVAIGVYVAGLGALAAWGISATVWVAGTITIASIVGLLLVLWVSAADLAQLPAVLPVLVEPQGLSGAAGAIVLGAFVAFYAFIGFEDMVNVAEETRQPADTMPRAIVGALLIATFLYLLVAMAAVLASQRLDLADHPAPLAAMVADAGPRWPAVIAALSMLSVTNSALAQVVMASRVLYGLARQGQAPRPLAAVNAARQTPIPATLLTAGSILLLALFFPLLTLAKATSFVILLVFALVNLALLRLKLSGRLPARGRWIPVVGSLLSLGLLVLAGL